MLAKNSLVSKMIITFTTIIAVSFIIMASFLSIWFEGYYFEERKSLLDKQGKTIATSAMIYVDEQQESALNKLKSDLSFAQSTLGADIVLTDAMGYVYQVSSDDYKNLMFTNLNIKEMDELRAGRSVEKKGKFDEPFNSPCYIYVKPIFVADTFRGVIFMHTPLDQIKSPLNKVYTIIWMCAILAIVFSTIIIYYFAQRILINPLSKINIAARKIAKGEVERRAYINSNDEIGELAESFNIMADSLEQVEKNRREFMSNVSHELRSPITSIKGFIGGVIDGVVPKGKETYYLNIAYDEIQRLARLVNDLLDLASMESGKFSLRIIELDIIEIVKICVIKFEQRINEKKLKVDVTFPEDHIYVAGDRDRMIQVVTNLLDNSLKYAKDNGTIKLTIKDKGDKIQVSIYNDGPPISDEDIAHIWDRFYKGDKSRTSKVSTGLGLPIVRNILTQLGEDIWVENNKRDKEEGVIFTFTLTKA